MSETVLTRIDFTCDYPGCGLPSFAEVYPDLGKNPMGGWSYLCLPHFIQEQIVFKKDMGWTLAAWLYRMPFVRWLWNFYCTNSWFNKKCE